MKEPYFTPLHNGIEYSMCDLMHWSFEEYRQSEDFKQVVAVRIRKYGPETKNTKAHDYVVTYYFKSRKPITKDDIKYILDKWSNAYKGVYFYELVEEPADIEPDKHKKIFFYSKEAVTKLKGKTIILTRKHGDFDKGLRLFVHTVIDWETHFDLFCKADRDSVLNSEWLSFPHIPSEDTGFLVETKYTNADALELIQGLMKDKVAADKQEELSRFIMNHKKELSDILGRVIQ